MLTQVEYWVAWCYYLVGVGLILGCWWHLTAKATWPKAKQLSRLLLAVVLLVPWYTVESSRGTYLSPAWLMSVVEGLFQGGKAFWRAGLPLTVAIVMVLSGAAVFYLWRALYTRKRALNRSEYHVAGE